VSADEITQIAAALRSALLATSETNPC
jgi:hypothetical protein